MPSRPWSQPLITAGARSGNVSTSVKNRRCREPRTLADASLVGEGLLARVLGRPELLARLLDHAGRVHRHSRTLGHRRTTSRLQDVVHGAVAARSGSAHVFCGTCSSGVGTRAGERATRHRAAERAANASAATARNECGCRLAIDVASCHVAVASWRSRSHSRLTTHATAEPATPPLSPIRSSQRACQILIFLSSAPE